METTHFLESSPGNWSVSRLIALLVVVVAILDAQAILIFGLKHPETSLLPIATAVGAVFASIATPALTYLFFIKKDESSQPPAPINLSPQPPIQ